MELHGPSRFAVKAKIYGVLYNQAPDFSAFHWSPRGNLVSIGQHFVITRVVHLRKRTETSLITESDRFGPIRLLSLFRTLSPNRTRLWGPCIAAIAGSCYKGNKFWDFLFLSVSLQNKGGLCDTLKVHGKEQVNAGHDLYFMDFMDH